MRSNRNFSADDEHWRQAKTIEIVRSHFDTVAYFETGPEPVTRKPPMRAITARILAQSVTLFLVIKITNRQSESGGRCQRNGQRDDPRLPEEE